MMVHISKLVYACTYRPYSYQILLKSVPLICLCIHKDGFGKFGPIYSYVALYMYMYTKQKQPGAVKGCCQAK